MITRYFFNKPKEYISFDSEEDNNKQQFDYLSVLWPEGDALIDRFALFNEEDIEKVVEVQETRESNGARSEMVGSRVSGDVDLAGDRAEISGSVKYTSDAAALRSDYDELGQLIDEFNAFADKVNLDGDALMQNWHAGNKREETSEELDTFKTIAIDSHEKMTNAYDQLGIACSNIENISE